MAYSDVFSYPLTKQEIWNRLIAKEMYSYSEFEDILRRKNDFFDEQEGWYFLRGHKRLVSMRKKVEKESKRKMKRAVKIVRALTFIPTVKLIGISGSVAVSNAKSSDDIDLFIISAQNTLWITRLLVLCMLEIFGARRTKNDKRIKDKLCPNLFMDEEYLSFSPSWRNLYVAYEIMLMQPIFTRGVTYRRFLSANQWISSFLPHCHIPSVLHQTQSPSMVYKTLCFILSVCNPIAKHLQIISIKKTQTTEIISDTLLAFYPRDKKESVIREFTKRIKKIERMFYQEQNLHVKSIEPSSFAFLS